MPNKANTALNKAQKLSLRKTSLVPYYKKKGVVFTGVITRDCFNKILFPPCWTLSAGGRISPLLDVVKRVNKESQEYSA